MNLIEDLQIFVRIAHAGSLSQAARELDLSVASVSKRLERLESQLGARLFHRSTHGLKLSEEGNAALDHAARLLDDSNALLSLFNDNGASVPGTLRIAAPSRFGERYVAPTVARFLADYPETNVELHLTDRRQDLVREGLDMAVRIGPLADSSRVAQRLCGSHRVVVASPAYLERRGNPTVPDDLAGHDCLVLEDNDVWTFRINCEVRSVRVGAKVRCRQGDAVGVLCRAGVGIALKSVWDVAEDICAGHLVPLLVDYRVERSADISILLPHHRFVPPRVRRFIETLRREIGDPPPWEKAYSQGSPSV